MTLTRKMSLLAASGLLGVAAPAVAHHAATMFDKDHPVTMTGTVEQFRWLNPHSSIVFKDDATQVTWRVETTSPGVLSRFGWTKRSLNPGDKIEITLAPHRDGGPAGIARHVTNLTTGEKLRRPM